MNDGDICVFGPGRPPRLGFVDGDMNIVGFGRLFGLGSTD